MVYNGVSVLVESCCQMCFRSSESDGVCNALTKRTCGLGHKPVLTRSPVYAACQDETREDQTCGNLDTLSLKVFRVTRGLALPLSELLAVLQLHAS